MRKRRGLILMRGNNVIILRILYAGRSLDLAFD
jgi:hypothetical protein